LFQEVKRELEHPPMSRFKIGVALGSAAVYFFDPLQGEGRRRRVQSLWRENRDTAFEVGGRASQAAESMRPLARRMKRRLERGDWPEDDGANWVPTVAGIAVATAVGGALVYFLDRQNGLARRQRGFRSVQKAAGTLKPWAQHAAGEAAEAAESVRAMGRG
jgi:hypothetical protein